MGGEIYSGWYAKWGDISSSSFEGAKSVEQFIHEYDKLLRNNHSFTVYMAHGGTNFGLTAGANTNKIGDIDYTAIITSYDYDAPIG